ncbi:MAG: glycine betaine ABC transporter substrate-binding protein [Desulfatiglandaceae bacterium]
MKRNPLLSIILLLSLIMSLFLFSCQKSEPIRVGSKNFSENQILAHMIQLMAMEAAVPVDPSIVYGNTFDLQEALNRGEIHVYPEYTGTAALIMGIVPSDESDELYERVQELYKSFGLDWQERFGFDNAYSLVMTNKQAVFLGIESISDLVRLQGDFALGADPEFFIRPVDGFNSLLRRYGISPEPEVVRKNTKQKLYQDLIREKIHVAVGQKTDPQILEYGLVVLEDDLRFFSVYEPAPVVREDILQRYPELGDALQKLAGILDLETMRLLNHSAIITGADERVVAEWYLKKEGLITLPDPLPRQRELMVATSSADHQTELMAVAAGALRAAFPKRELKIETFEDPVQELIDGDTFAAVLGAEHFFKIRPEQFPERLEQVEAIAPVGNRFVHLIRKKNQSGDNNGLAKGPFAGVDRLGAGWEKSSSATISSILLDAYGRSDRVSQVYGPLEKQIEELKNGHLDAVLIMTMPGDFHVAQIMEDPDLEMQPMTFWRHQGRHFRYPFIREGRITPPIYPGLEEPVDTVYTQVVIAGPRGPEPSIGEGDPVSGISTRKQSIPKALKEKIAVATGRTEAIDPALPGENVFLLSRHQETLPLNPQPAVSFITALLFVLFIAMLFAIFRKKTSK